MNPIELLYVKNIITEGEAVEQLLEFGILVENHTFRKTVDVFWAGEDGVWKVLGAHYHASAGWNREHWRAQEVLEPSASGALPGNIRFALRYQVPGKEYWDNNFFRDYTAEADCGALINPKRPLLNLGFQKLLLRGQKDVAIAVGAHESLRPERVQVVWTTDRWKTRHLTSCTFQKDYWKRAFQSRAKNPTPYGWLIYTGRLGIKDAYRVEYAISCRVGREKIWDNNFEKNYLARRERLKVLTLNLHCCQEENQEDKFRLIARAIHELQIDIVCFQEVAEFWNGGQGDWRSNAARIIREHLRRSYQHHYHLHTDWSHLGFGQYREGSAILSRYKFLALDSRYVSGSTDPYDIHARKVVMAQVHVPYMGVVNIFSAHLSWWSGGFGEQFENLRGWVGTLHHDSLSATLLCGDFNSKAGSEGYSQVVSSGEYDDAFLEATDRDTFEKIFRRTPSNNGPDALRDDHRIDYLFLRKGSRLKVACARMLFTENDYGSVSDHLGYYAEFEPA